MTTTNNDLKIYYSGASSNEEPIFESYMSLGGYRSSILVSNAKIDGLFEEVPVGDAYIGRVDIRCLFVKNTHTTDAMYNLSFYVEGKKNYEKIFFGVSNPSNDVSGFVQRLNSSQEEPYNITWYESYTSQEKIILKPILAAGKMFALWLKREIVAMEEPMLKQDSILNFKFSWE